MIWGIFIVIMIVIMIIAAISGFGSLIAVEILFNPIVGIVLIIAITAIIITKIICNRR